MKNRRNSSSCSVDISEENGVRYLHFGSDWVQGAMRIARPWSLELAYTREMMAGLLFQEAQRWPKRVLQIGLGAGSLSKFIYRHLPQARATVVEINPQVELMARHYFKLPDDPMRLEICIDDGAEYVLRSQRSYDYLLVDGFDADAKAGVLDTLPFYQACRSRLSEDGLFCVNLLGKNRGFQASLGRLNEAFDGRVLALPACESGNVIVLATGGAPLSVSQEALLTRAQKLRSETRLNLLPTLARMEKTGVFTDGTISF